ncbi:MAG: glycerol-3-phosphate responsive antiterminator [Clostridiales bacterium]|nr:glycerol-3-phosphate responsive antiterminator [Clostridiales bacterium]
MRHQMLSILERNPVIASVKDVALLPAALSSPCEVLFLLCGDVCNIGQLVEQIHAAGKYVIVHADLVQGLSQKEIAADFLLQCKADGIISTRPNLIRRGRELSLLTVLRVFAIDSKAVSNLTKERDMALPDVVEVLPGILPRVIARISASLHIPVIAGGLVEEKEDIVSALSSGALCVSTTHEALWDS